MAKYGSPRRDRFVIEYPKDLNGTNAAKRAGFSAKTAGVTAAQLLANPRIKAAIQAKLEAREKRSELTSDYVLTGIRELVDRCTQRVEVLDDDGKPTGEWRFEPNPAMRGYELLGKHLRLFADVHEVHFAKGLAERMKRAESRVGSRS